MKTFMGIDPGQSGGIAIIFENGKAEVTKMPETERDVFDIIHEYTYLDLFCMLEKVHAMPGQGVTSMFKFGQGYGFIRGCLISLDIPFDDVTPQKWQKHIGCLTGGDKNVSKSKAQQLYPYLKITHATADALLIARYAMEIYR
jgi:hypothetical protein